MALLLLTALCWK